MDQIVLVVCVGLINVLCFFIGAKVGQKVVKNEAIEMPSLNPVKVVKEIKDEYKASQEVKDLEATLENINNFDGSSIGQKKI